MTFKKRPLKKLASVLVGFLLSTIPVFAQDGSLFDSGTGSTFVAVGIFAILLWMIGQEVLKTIRGK